MGSSFANLQVRVGVDGPEASLIQVREAVHRWMVDQGFLPAEAEEPTRSVLIGVDPGRRWINVYDSAIDQFDIESLQGLGGSLSMATETPVVGVLVFDSDVAGYVLFDGGQEIDWLTDRPGSFEEMLGPTNDDDGDVRRWKPVLPSGVDPQSFEQALRGDGSEDDVFADHRAADALALLGMDPDRATVGYRYAMENGQPIATEHHAFAPDPAKADARADDEGSQPTLGGFSGSPDRGTMVGGFSNIVVPVGAVTDLDFVVINMGAPFRGLSVHLGGSAIDDQLIRADRIYVGSAMQVLGQSGFEPIEDELRGRVAYDLPDLDVPTAEQVTIRFSVSGTTVGGGQAVIEIRTGGGESSSWSTQVKVPG
jgi:hypothetical protein